MKKGLSGWVEIFRGGKQFDSLGNEHDGDRLIDQAIATFNAKTHEPPAVVGHPRDDAPAFAWVEGLKKSGATLLAKFRQVVPEFEDAVKQGLYKKRSASFYPDGRLRHVGFLGGAPPAVKGLADIGFNDDDSLVTFEFEERQAWQISAMGGIFQRLREFVIEKFGADDADKIVQNWEIEEFKREPETREPETLAEPAFSEPSKKEELGMPYTEEDMQAKLAAQKAQFTEQLSAMESKMEGIKADARKAVEAEFAESAKKQAKATRDKELIAFCDTRMASGQLLPAWKKAGIVDFIQHLDADEAIEFGEGDEKLSALDWFKNFLEELPKVVEFKEIADRETDVGTGDAGAKLETLTRAKMVEKDLVYSAAFAEVQTEHPDLAAEYMTQMKGEK